MIKKYSQLKTANDIKSELIRKGAEVHGDKVVLYRGGNVSEEILKNLRYNEYLSIVRDGTDADGNAGASNYGKNVVQLYLPIKDIKITNGEIQYIGNSNSLKIKKGKYPLLIYKAFNDVYGSNYTAKEIDAMEEREVKAVASQGLSDGREEFDLLLKKWKK